MKRYWVFAWSNYYPDGGLNDLRLCTDDLQEAKKELARKTKNGDKEEVDFNAGEGTYEFGHIFDMQELISIEEIEDTLEFGVFAKNKEL
jgi:hypothetical protein